MPIHPSVLRSVPVESIELDRDNPRIKQWLEMYPNPTTEQIFQALGAGSDDGAESSSTTFEKLKQSILTNGGVIQPVILNETEDRRLVCVEGNTRVAIYRDFLAQGKSGHWSTIPALVHRGLDAAGIDAVRLQVHLVPPRGWEPYAKAKYLNYLRNEEHLSFGQNRGLRRWSIQRKLSRRFRPTRTWSATIGQLIPSDGNFDTKKFRGFVELQKPGIKEAIFAARFTLTDFAHWIYEERIYPLAMVRRLPHILRHDEARKVFLKEDARRCHTARTSRRSPRPLPTPTWRQSRVR